MKTKIIFSFFFLFSIKLSAQSTFQIGFTDSLYNSGYALVQKADGGYCILGNVNSSGLAQVYNLIVYNTDRDGNLIWSYIYGTVNGDFASNIIKLDDGGFVISATTTSEILIYKIDSLGSILWSKTFAGAPYMLANRLLLSPDGGILVSGSSASQAAQLMKIDSNGNFIWATLCSSQVASQYNSICFDNQGRIIVGGYTNNGSYSSLLTSVIDTSGNILSCKIRKSPSNISIQYKCSILASNGDMIFCGVADGTNSYKDAFVTRQDQSGNIIWQKIYWGMGEVSSVSEDSLHNFHLATSRAHLLSNSYNAYLLSIDGNGNLLNACNYFYDKSAMKDVIITDDGMIAAVGSSGNTGSKTTFLKADLNLNSGCRQQTVSVTGSNFTTIDSTGYIQQSIAINSVPVILDKTSTTNTQSTPYCFSTDIAHLKNNNQISIYPNPSSGKFRIETGNYGQHQLDIYNSTGQKIIYKEFTGEYIDIILTNYSNGVYYFKIDKIRNGKIMLTN